MDNKELSDIDVQATFPAFSSRMHTNTYGPHNRINGFGRQKLSGNSKWRL